MKGSLEGVLPMMGLLILAAVLGAQSLPVAEALASVLDESSEEIDAVSETNANSDYITESYIPSSMTYSVNNAAYELDDGGINWESEASSASEPHLILGSVLDEWESTATSNLESRLENHRCSLEFDPIYRVYPDDSSLTLYNRDNIESVDYRAFNFDGIEISCSSQTEYRQDTYIESGSSTNRYIELAKAGSEFFYEVEEAYSDNEENVQSSYEETVTSCGPFEPGDTYALDEAVDSYESDTNSIGNIGSEIETPDGISTSYSSTDRYDAISNPPPEDTGVECPSGECIERADISCSSKDIEECDGIQGCRVGTNQVGELRCEDDPSEEFECIDRENYHDDEAEIAPTYTSIDFEVTDKEIEVLAESSYRNLDITVNDYRFSY